MRIKLIFAAASLVIIGQIGNYIEDNYKVNNNFRSQEIESQLESYK